MTGMVISSIEELRLFIRRRVRHKRCKGVSSVRWRWRHQDKVYWKAFPHRYWMLGSRL